MFAAVVAKIMPQTGTRGVVVNNRMKCQVGQDHTCAKLKGHANPKIHVFLIFCKKWRKLPNSAYFRRKSEIPLLLPLNYYSFFNPKRTVIRTEMYSRTKQLVNRSLRMQATNYIE